MSLNSTRTAAPVYRPLLVALGVALCVVLPLTTGAGRADAALGTFGSPGFLGNAESFAVVAGTAITNASGSVAPETVVSGDMAIYPGPGTSITGFPPGDVVNGATYTPTSPAASTTAFDARADVTAAFIQVDLLAPTFPNPGVGPVELGGTSPLPGVYSADDFLLNNSVTLDGDWDDIWVFQANTLTTGVNSSVILTGDANPCNVFWHLDSAATIEVGTELVGTVFAGTSIAAKNAASIDGRLLAAAAVTLDQNQISTPLCLTGPSTPPTTGGGGGGTGGGTGTGGNSTLANTGNAELAATGVDVTRPLLVALLVTLSGTALVALAGLRRRRTA
ncbi:hypothetical protein BH09ACT5_BH09ACT5_09770 [soil metagenome]